MGVFVVFEGGEGAGKSTQARLLHRRLIREGYTVLLTREPGGTGLGEAVRRWLKTRPGLTSLAELALLTAARSQHVEQVISPALGPRQVVICDRFTASTVAYQGHGRGIDLELIYRLNEGATQGLRPDLTILIDLPVGAGLSRKKGGPQDTFESQAVEFHRRVRESYHALASEEPDRWLVLDGTLGERALAAQVRAGVQPILDRLGPGSPGSQRS